MSLLSPTIRMRTTVALVLCTAAGALVLSAESSIDKAVRGSNSVAMRDSWLVQMARSDR
jgi:hypothetical protein